MVGSSPTSRRLLLAVALTTLVVLLTLGFAVVWAARSGDQISAERQVQVVKLALSGAVDQVAQDQEVVAIWDDPVAELRKPNPDWAWFDANIGFWLRDLFGHDRVYVLDQSDRPIYAAIDGARREPQAFEALREPVSPLIESIRGRDKRAAHRHERLPNQPIHPQAQLRTSEKALHATHLLQIENRPAAVSVMTFQALSGGTAGDGAGQEKLLVSVRFLDGDFLRQLAERSLIEGADFRPTPTLAEGERAIALRGEHNELVSYLVWTPELPGQRMLKVLAPFLVAACAIIVLAMIFLLGTARRMTRQLEGAVYDLDQANRAKSEFLANMSHEIRTPLNGVLGMAQVVEADELSPRQRGRLRVIRESGAALLAILNDVLDFAKAEAGKLELHPAPFRLEDLGSTVTAAFEGTAAAKDLSLRLEIEDAARGWWMGDLLRLRQVLSNLVSNALKFTNVGEVVVTVRCIEDGLAFEVRDTGIGIDPRRAPLLFDAFAQEDASTSRQYGGTGLGLSISRRLTELMGGRIEVTSRKGAGSCFTVFAPLTRAATPRTAEVADPAPAAQTADAGLRILAAEDNPINQLVLRSVLSPLEPDLTLVGDGREALEAFKTGAFDFVLMDIQMPNMDGVEATRAIRAWEAAQGRAPTPIIAVSANVMPYQLREYLAAGMSATVCKPIELSQLYGTLNDIAMGEVEAEPARVAS